MNNTVQILIHFTSDLGNASIAIGTLGVLTDQVLRVILPT
jgi:hypothetical protein